MSVPEDQHRQYRRKPKLDHRHRMGQQRTGPRRALLVGHADEARRLRAMLSGHPDPPFQLIGYVAAEEKIAPNDPEDLPRLGADIRAASGVAISRAHVIRALIDALSESDLDLTGTRSEADLKAILTARLGRVRG